jgi:hypothetical protein
MGRIRLGGAAVVAALVLTAMSSAGASASRLVLTEELIPVVPGTFVTDVLDAEPCSEESGGVIVDNDERVAELALDGFIDAVCPSSYMISEGVRTTVEAKGSGVVKLRFSPKLAITELLDGGPCVYEYPEVTGLVPSYPTGSLQARGSAIGRLNRKASLATCDPARAQAFRLSDITNEDDEEIEYEVRG